MAEEVQKERKIEDIEQDYTRQAVKLGDLRYAQYQIENDIELICERMRDLVREGKLAKQKEPKKEEVKNESQS